MSGFADQAVIPRGRSVLEDSPSLEMLPRSRLFSLPLAGESNASQEAILDFAQRLSHAHHLRVRDLLAQVILPEAGVTGAFYIPGHFSQQAIRGCNGWSAYGQALLAAMQRLTGRADMCHGSLANWAPLLSDSGYVARRRRWCAACLRRREQRGQQHWFSLIWAFEAVRICPTHRVPLSQSCGRCGRGQPWISDAVAEGRCAHCRTPLGEAPPGVRDPLDAARASSYANAVADMISAARLPPSVVTIANYQSRLREVANRVSGGSLMRLERQLNLNASTMASHRRHTLAFFLELLFRLGTTPMAFLTGDFEGVPEPRRTKERLALRRVLSTKEIEAARERVEGRLKVALSDDTQITSRIRFVADVGISNACFGRQFREAKAALRAHNDKVRRLLHQRLWESRAHDIGEAMRGLIARRAPLTSSNVSKALVEIGLHRRHPVVRQLAAAAIDSARHQELPSGTGTQPI